MKKQMAVKREGILVGEYTHFDRCRFCYDNHLVPIINFGYVPLAGGFIAKGSTEADFKKEKRFPLHICYCPHCHLVQVNDIIDGNTLFKNYFYFSSAIGTLVKHFADYAKELRAMYVDPGKRYLVELGCNDGVFMKPLLQEGFKVTGVDPATNVVAPLIKEGFDIVNDFFTPEIAQDLVKKHGQADAILSSNSFAHINDMREVLDGIKILLKPDGFLAFEVHYLGTLIKEVQYDMMYHEHQSYYSLLTLEKFFNLYKMEIYDVKILDMHAGSRRYYAQNKLTGKQPVTQAVKEMRRQEKQMGLDTLAAYQKFYQRIDKTRKDLCGLITRLKKSGKTIAGYGASGRATAIMSFCQITQEHLDYVVDDAPAKIGAYTPGNHLEIKSSTILDGPHRPDYVIIFAWAFINEIKTKKSAFFQSGGKFIVPLPKVMIIDH